MTSSETIAAKLRTIPDVDRMVGTYVKDDGVNGIVNIGDKSVTLPCIGFTRPQPGSPVQLERRRGQLVVLGPAAPLNPYGKVTATGTPKCTVLVDGVSYLLGYRSTYTPAVNDDVEINWATSIIQGKVTTTPAPGGPGANPGGDAGALDPAQPILAGDSGRFRSGAWDLNDVHATDYSSGAWFYGSRVKDYLAGATPATIEIYLPLIERLGFAYIGVHGYASKPGGWTGLALSAALDNRAGWVSLPASFGAYLRDNVGGIAVESGNGLNRWRGTAGDSLSGALRFTGKR